MLSQALDLLFCDVPGNLMSKMEVYTFGSAAGHLNNPTWGSTTDIKAGRDDGNQRGKPTPGRMIRHIEHYVNSLDMVTRWGILYNVCDVLDNRFAGSIFIRMGATGHMLNQHYLGPMFPKAHQEAGRGKDTETKSKSASSPTDCLIEDAIDSFFDQIVTVDVATGQSRDQLANDHLAFLRRESSGLSFNSRTSLEFGNKKRVRLGQIGNAELTDGVGSPLSFVGKGGMAKWGEDGPAEGFDKGHEDYGKSVKELSWLWRYLGGGQPNEDEDEDD